MKIIADLQLHSKYSRAVSDKMTIDEIWRWSAKKGIGIVATGDWTHPLWIREIKSKLVERGDGILELKKEYKEDSRKSGLVPKDMEPFFLLATEVSSIYMQGGKQRRVHNLIWSPSIAAAEKINAEFVKRGCNLSSDGRPIVGLSSEEVAQIVFSVDETCLLIPAHAWTPWFSLFGSKSGFDTVEECFGKYAKYIYAVETGLSSDPLMNWEIENLDNRAIVSFSDAHSGPKLGREATVFNLEKLSYDAIRRALMNTNAQRLTTNDFIACTFEFYPEEGKYHYDGHRNCSLRQTPEETRTRGVMCPVCGRALTVGVMYRVEELSNRTIKPVIKKDTHGVRWIYHPKNTRPPFVNIVPLLEIIGEALHVGTSAQRSQTAYDKLVSELNGEFTILLKASIEDIEKVSTKDIARAIAKVRAGDIFIDPGYDGVFGKVKVWPEDKKEVDEKDEKEQMSLF